MQSVRPLTLLHLADIQIGLHGDFETVKDLGGGITREITEAFLEEALEPLGRVLCDDGEADGCTDVFVVLSGDVTSTAAQGEFELAEVFLEGLIDALGERYVGMMMVPGNHDVAWDHSRLDDGRRMKMKPYVDFARRLFKENKARFDPRRALRLSPAFRMGNDPAPNDLVLAADLREDYGIYIVGLNTCEEESHERHFAYVSRAQIRLVEKMLDRATNAQGARDLEASTVVAVMHHNPLPVQADLETAGTDPKKRVDRGYVNAVQVLRSLRNHSVDLVLHGHRHRDAWNRLSVWQPDEDQVGANGNPFEDPPLYVASAGAFGAARRHRAERSPRSFSLLELFANRRSSHGLCCARIMTWEAGDWVQRESFILPGVHRSPIKLSGDGSVTPQTVLSSLLPASSNEEALEVALQVTQTVAGPDLVLLLSDELDPDRARLGKQAIVGSDLSRFEEEQLASVYDDSAESPIEYVFQSEPNLRSRVLSRMKEGGDVLGGFATSRGYNSFLHLYDVSLRHSAVDNDRNAKLHLCVGYHSAAHAAPGPMEAERPEQRRFCQSDFPVLLRRCLLAHDAFEHDFLAKIDPAVAELYRASYQSLQNWGTKGPARVLYQRAEAFFHRKRRNREFAAGFRGPIMLDQAGRKLDFNLYREQEGVLFILKKKIEKLFLLSLAFQEIEAVETNGELGGPDFARVFDPLIVETGARAEALREEPRSGKGLNPLLVSFYLPCTAPENRDGCFGLRFFPTRDQLAWLVSDRTQKSQDRVVEAETLINSQMRGYAGRVFEGVAAYVFETQEAFRSKAGLTERLVNGDHLRYWASKADPEVASAMDSVGAEFDQRIALRREITSIERDRWAGGAGDVQVLDIPVVHHGETLAVVQIQTEQQYVLERIGPIALSVLKEATLPLALRAADQGSRTRRNR